MTGLPYESAQTTGTVAVAKWGRVTLLSPRASHHGYPWRDTVAHELTHLAVTRASRDRAPLWLQEGVAKREEIRWRDPGPFDDRPPPEAVVQRGLELGLGVPLDKLGPSIAMLPERGRGDDRVRRGDELRPLLRRHQAEVEDGRRGRSWALAKLFAELRDGRIPTRRSWPRAAPISRRGTRDGGLTSRRARRSPLPDDARARAGAHEPVRAEAERAARSPRPHAPGAALDGPRACARRR